MDHCHYSAHTVCHCRLLTGQRYSNILHVRHRAVITVVHRCRSRCCRCARSQSNHPSINRLSINTKQVAVANSVCIVTANLCLFYVCRLRSCCWRLQLLQHADVASLSTQRIPFPNRFPFRRATRAQITSDQGIGLQDIEASATVLDVFMLSARNTIDCSTSALAPKLNTIEHERVREVCSPLLSGFANTSVSLYAHAQRCCGGTVWFLCQLTASTVAPPALQDIIGLANFDSLTVVGGPPGTTARCGATQLHADTLTP